MSVTEKTIETAVLKALKKMREITPKRNFVESVEVQLALKGIDLKRPENRFKAKITMPYPITDVDKITVFADDPHMSPLKPLSEKGVIRVIGKAKLEEIASNKREIRKLAKRTRIFLASTTLMSKIGRYFGRYLSPRNKMPIPVPITGDIVKAVENAKKTVSVSLQKSPTVHGKIGNIKMDDKELAANVTAFVMNIKNRLPKGWTNVKSIHIKTTMGPSVKVEYMQKAKRKR